MAKKKELENITTEALKEVLSIVRSTKKFVGDKVPALAKEILMTQRLDHMLDTAVLLGVVFSIKALAWYLWGLASVNDGYRDSNDGAKAAIAVLGGGLGLLFLGLLANSLMSTVKTFLTPKLVVIEYLIKMVKNEE